MPSDSSAFLDNPLALARHRHWKDLCAQTGGVDPEFRWTARKISAVSCIFTPLHALEDALYGRRIRETRIDQPPLFILGHWRTGTTHLHYLFSQDPLLSYITTFQTLLPGACIVGDKVVGPLIRHFMPKERPVDGMPLGPETPQEEEVALTQISLHSYYAGLYFPRAMPHLFDRYVMFKNASPGDIQAWKTDYFRLLQKISYLSDGKRLVLKCPMNSARIRYLLELFPDAKFIHLHRNPYDVFYSTKKFFRGVFDMVGLQHFSEEAFENHILNAYRELLQAYLNQRGLIPEGSLVEVAYADLIRDPEKCLKNIYADLDLPGHEEAWRHMSEYLPEQRDFQPAEHVLRDADEKAIRKQWQFAFDEWGYARA